MENFTLHITNPFFAGWLILLGSFLVFALIATILGIVVYRKSGHEKEGFTVYMVFIIFAAVFGSVFGGMGTGAASQSITDAAVIHGLHDAGYSHVTYNRDTFTASYHGKYVYGDILEKNDTTFLVVIEK